jgi:hypothetical protein
MPRRVDPQVQFRLAELANDPGSRTWGPTQIHAKLCEEFPTEDEDGRQAISLRKVQEELPKLRDTSEAWTLRPGDPDPAFTLRTLAVLGETGGASLSQQAVGWLRVVHAARPDLLPGDALHVAVLYMVSPSVGQPGLCAVLDLLLGQQLSANVIVEVWGKTGKRLMRAAAAPSDAPEKEADQ